MAKGRRPIFVIAMLGFLCATAARADQIAGPFRGTLVCSQLKTANNILRAPLDVVVRSSDVIFARPIYNANGTFVVGSELGSGTLSADGKIHLTSTWENGGFGFTGDYSGTLAAGGGTLTGTEAWHSRDGMVETRTCMGALVPIHVRSE